jgi:hypothetical protein
MKDEINSKDIQPCPTCGSPCVIAGNITRYYVPVDLGHIAKLLKSGDKALNRVLAPIFENLSKLLNSKP